MTRVLQLLVEEGVSVRNLQQILEAVTLSSAAADEPAERLAEKARAALGRAICHAHAAPNPQQSSDSAPSLRRGHETS